MLSWLHLTTQYINRNLLYRIHLLVVLAQVIEVHKRISVELTHSSVPELVLAMLAVRCYIAGARTFIGVEFHLSRGGGRGGGGGL